MTNETRKLLDDFAIAHHKETGDWPIVIGIECYEMMRNSVKIIEASDFGSEVTIEDRFLQRSAVDFDNLTWHFGRHHFERIMKGEIII